MALTNHSIGILISRILGIYAFFGALAYFPGVEFFTLWYSLTGFFLHLGLSYFLLMHAPLVATFLMSETEPSEHTTSLTIEQVTTVAFIIIGVITLMRVIPQLAGTFTLHTLGEFQGRNITRLLPQALEVGLGVWLTFGAKGIAKFIERVRSEHPNV
ncbi:MAG: hypothetical protein HY276_08485 [Ignavibacteriales bacterium]|nr:hypothetical protein [Ignavibacteriales bacterium]MBI3788279.1 hypothetical protein [Ignavibacteriales bacterium]